MKKDRLLIFFVEHYWVILLVSALLLFGFFSKEVSFISFIVLAMYVVVIKLFWSGALGGNVKRYVLKSIWIVAASVLVATYYVNHYMPHGESYSTGEIICQNDGRGPCTDAYKEDVTSLNIPEWAKFLRSNGTALLIALVFAGIILAESKEQKQSAEKSRGEIIEELKYCVLSTLVIIVAIAGLLVMTALLQNDTNKDKEADQELSDKEIEEILDSLEK